MNTEVVLELTHETHRKEIERLKADYTRELDAKLEQINRQAETITDERQRREQAEVEVARLAWKIDSNDKTKIQLLSALAAIEKVKEIPGRNDFGDNDTLRQIRECLNAVDLSLLREHVRKEQKPLVDALVYYRDECSGNEPSLSVFHKMLDDALAKIKQ